MRFTYIKLKNYIGIYQGCNGLKELYIDFTKCISNITLIIGKNGSGKTTIWEALQPIPISPSKFIEKEPGFIELDYMYNDILYSIREVLFG